MNKKNIMKIIIKIVLTIGTIYLSLIVGLYLSIFLSITNINIFSIIWSVLLLPSFLLILIYSQKKKKFLKFWGINLLLFLIVFGINFGINKYEEYITIDTNVNINCQEYLPFEKESKIVKLDYEASLKLKDNLPRVDGSAAVFPVYSAFVNATYPDAVKLRDGVFEYRNTVDGYRALALKESDIFFGAKPSEEQILSVA